MITRRLLLNEITNLNHNNYSSQWIAKWRDDSLLLENVFSPVSIHLWEGKMFVGENDSPQMSGWYGFLQAWIYIWVVRWQLWVNDLTRHLNKTIYNRQHTGMTPFVYKYACLLKAWAVEKHVPLILQLYALSPVWILLCLLKSLICQNDLPDITVI